jgi:two-component system response regulator MprA
VSSENVVLVVDDDLDLRLTLADALTISGFRVVGASNGREALELLCEQQLRPDVILLDMMMPEMDGWAFRDEQRKRGGELGAIPVVVFSAYTFGESAMQELDAAGYVRKPASLTDLVAAVRKAATGAKPDDDATPDGDARGR